MWPGQFGTSCALVVLRPLFFHRGTGTYPPQLRFRFPTSLSCSASLFEVVRKHAASKSDGGRESGPRSFSGSGGDPVSERAWKREFRTGARLEGIRGSVLESLTAFGTGPISSGSVRFRSGRDSRKGGILFRRDVTGYSGRSAPLRRLRGGGSGVRRNPWVSPARRRSVREPVLPRPFGKGWSIP